MFNASSLYATVGKCLIFETAIHQPKTSKSILDDLSIVTTDNTNSHAEHLEIDRSTAVTIDSC